MPTEILMNPQRYPISQRIEHRKHAELTPYANNPNRHAGSQIAQIAGSISQSTSGSLTNAPVASASGTLPEGQGAD
jgi:hypothetical protein